MPPEELKADKKGSRKIGPCALGKRAMYLNSFFIDRKFYVLYTDVSRVFKRVAMSKGGFTGKGVFGSIPYLVVKLRSGQERQCNFKYEDDVDKFLSVIEAEHPEIPIYSEAGERKIAEARAKEEARYLKTLSPEAEQSVETLRKAQDELAEHKILSEQLAYAAKQKRTIDMIHPTYRLAAMAIFILAAGAAVFGVVNIFQHKGYAAYFILFGIAFMLFAMATRVMPTGRNNKRSAQKDYDQALSEMQAFISQKKDFPVPYQYAHPATLTRMIRVIREGRAQSTEEAYEVMKADLKAINSSVTVTQTEYDEIVKIKPMFLLCEYKDQI